MARTFASAAALALIGATVAMAGGGSQAYEGEITGDEKAVVELEVETGSGRRVVTEFTVRKFPLECEEGTSARLARARLAGRARVSRRGTFKLAASNASQHLAVEGRLRGGEAHGVIRYSGVTQFADETRQCEARGLSWTAAR